VLVMGWDRINPV